MYPSPEQTRTPRNARRGVVLIAVIFITIAITGMTLVLCRSVRVEAMASANHVASVQAAAVERGAEQYALALLAQQPDTVMDLDESYFYAVQLPDGYFWMIRPDFRDPSLPLFGLIDEGSKINLNAGTDNDDDALERLAEMLMALPNMPPELPYSVVDWQDEDIEIEDDGAENDYYMSLREPYYCKNAAFETVEEILLVRGAHPQLLYGTVPNAPVNTGSGSGIGNAFGGGGAAANADLWVARGIQDLITVYSKQPATQPATGGGGGGGATGPFNVKDGQQRNQLRTMLTDLLGQQRAGEIAANGNYTDIFDFYIKQKVTAEEFALFGNEITTSNDAPQQGRINLATAPREVLICLPSMDEAKADKIIAARRGGIDRRSLAWVADALGQDAVGIAVGDLVTGRSYQFTADICAVSLDGRAFRRVRVVIDTTGTLPQIIFRRDLTERGWPLDRQILASLRTGNGVPGSTRMLTTGGPLQ